MLGLPGFLQIFKSIFNDKLDLLANLEEHEEYHIIVKKNRYNETSPHVTMYKVRRKNGD